MTLIELTEPLFQYICRLNRSSRKGVSPEPGQVRAEIKSIFSDMRSRANGTPGLAQQYEKVEIVLMGFVDFMIKESGKPFGRGWKELAHEKNELAMDEKFFDMLDETLKDPSEQATERLAVYYECMGLGFTGWYAGQPEHLRKKMLEVSARIRGMMDTGKQICPEAYEKVDTRIIDLPVASSIVGLLIVFVGLAVVIAAANVALYMQKRTELKNAVTLESGYRDAGEATKEGGQ
jgi:type VI secretion system protein ImpK